MYKQSENVISHTKHKIYLIWYHIPIYILTLFYHGFCEVIKSRTYDGYVVFSPVLKYSWYALPIEAIQEAISSLAVNFLYIADAHK